MTNINGLKWEEIYRKYAETFSKVLTRIGAIKEEVAKMSSKLKLLTQIPDNINHAFLLNQMNGDTKLAEE